MPEWLQQIFSIFAPDAYHRWPALHRQRRLYRRPTRPATRHHGCLARRHLLHRLRVFRWE